MATTEPESKKNLTFITDSFFFKSTILSTTIYTPILKQLKMYVNLKAINQSFNLYA